MCRIAAPASPCELLEVGQGRGSKSLLLAAGAQLVHPSALVGIDSVGYKVAVSRERVRAAGLGDVVSCLEFDACGLAGPGLPAGLDRSFGVVLVDAPCSGTGTMRRHPEIAATLDAVDVRSLAELQLRMLTAASARVGEGGALVYATCSLLAEENEGVVAAFLAREEGRPFRAAPVSEAPACAGCAATRRLVSRQETPEGYFCSIPQPGGADGHFCARLVRA